MASIADIPDYRNSHPKVAVLTATGATNTFHIDSVPWYITDYGIVVEISEEAEVLFPWSRVLEVRVPNGTLKNG